MVEPDYFSYSISQIILVGCFHCNEGTKRKLCTEVEASGEAVKGYPQ